MAAVKYSLSFVVLVVEVTIICHPVWTAERACESMTSCDLYAELQEHSKLIAGFSYNVKKADNALKQLREEKITLKNRVKALEEELKEGENGSVFLTNQEAINKLTLEDKELEKRITNLTNNINELKDQVDVIYIDNLRNNDKDLQDLQSRVKQLNDQVKRLDEIVRNHTEKFGLLTSRESPEISDKDQIQVSALRKKHERLEYQVKQMGRKCGGNEEGDSLDSLGIELETVKSSYDTLQDQVTELQDKCVAQNTQLDRMLEELTRRVEEMEKAERENANRTVKLNVKSKIDPKADKVAVVRLSSPP
ncbi:uncharacterized protein MCAP_0864 [Anabrus simplex]|uniref:uncharacterized protein MCAP_0864 n=1 Tax=Anabrus simplex TaxID=316456 RepID=UPI0035A2AA91